MTADLLLYYFIGTGVFFICNGLKIRDSENEAPPRLRRGGFLERNTERPLSIRTLKGAVPCSTSKDFAQQELKVLNLWPRMYEDFVFSPKRFFAPFAGMFVFLFAVFVVLPSMLRAANLRHKEPEAPLKITEEEVRKTFSIDDFLLSPPKFNFFFVLWPNPSYELISKSPCYTTLRYRDYHAFYFPKNEGTAENNPAYWIMGELAFPRTIYIEDRIVFPGIRKEQLTRFEGKEIVVFGQLLGKERIRSQNDAGFAIIATAIGYMNSEGRMEWIALKNL